MICAIISIQLRNAHISTHDQNHHHRCMRCGERCSAVHTSSKHMCHVYFFLCMSGCISHLPPLYSLALGHVHLQCEAIQSASPLSLICLVIINNQNSEQNILDRSELQRCYFSASPPFLSLSLSLPPSLLLSVAPSAFGETGKGRREIMP